MAPGAQNVSDFVSEKVANGSRGAMTLEERRQKMRENVARFRGSASPKPERGLHRFNSFSSVDRPSTSFEDHRGMYYKKIDRWDTDTEQLDDSTIDGLEFVQPRHYHDFAPSPAPEESTEVSEISEITDDEDKYSVSASVRTEPVTHPTSYPLQSLNGALQGNGLNNWTNTSRTRIVNRGPSGSVSGNDYHARYFQQHNFRQGFTVGTGNAIPFHTRPSNSPSLRPRDTSAPPIRPRAMSPVIGERMNGHKANGYSADNIPRSATIEEDVEYGNPMEFGHARQIRITHQHSFSNLSQSSAMSRTSSVSDIRSVRSPSTRFRTKRSHVMSRKRNRSVAQELDYTPGELVNMTYQQLAEESFDYNPKSKQISSIIEIPENVTTLEEKCDFVRSLREKETAGPQVEDAKTPQEVFFASLSIDDYDEAGDHIVSQLSGLLDRLRKIRREKRKAAVEFEEEVTRREHTVTSKTESLQNELTRLRKSGQEALAAAASKV